MPSNFADILPVFLITYPILVFSLTLHEYGHAIAAKWCGDSTAESLGRISLNPLVHMDPFGTFLFPIIAIFSGVPLIGWAKPVPVVIGNLRRPTGENVIISMAGPMMNVFIAAVAMLALQLYKLVLNLHFADNPMAIGVGYQLLQQILTYTLVLNLTLFFFNLLPVPPLDGSHVTRLFLSRFAPPEVNRAFEVFTEYSFIAFIILMITPVLGIYLGLTAMPVAGLMDSYASWPLEYLKR